MQSAIKNRKKEIGREYPDPNENEIIAEMIKVTKVQLARIYKNARTLRQVHSKMHGCVDAEFIIEKDLPPEYRVGIFKEEKTYAAWIRFSNGKSEILHDKKGDTRGMAIKLLNVPGEKLIDNQKHNQAVDLVLANSPVFFAKNLAAFNGLLKASIAVWQKTRILLFFFPFHLKMLIRSKLKLLTKCKHVFGIQYFSGTPYQFGDETRAVKYHASPFPENKLEYTDDKDFDYLRKNMAATLDKHEIRFDFFIQFQTDADKMPIEDATVAWTSPFIKVATIVIPRQKFDTEERNLFADDLSYNIWHTLPEHRPLGSFNRGRKFIYSELYKFRTEKNEQIASKPALTAHMVED